MANITIPKKLEPIVKAFFEESPKAAKKLIIQAANAIYGSNEEPNFSNFEGRNHSITKDELEEICVLMHGIMPKDSLEAIFSAQIIVGHMLGMRKLSKGCLDDQRMGLKMLKFSRDTISSLQKKRSGGTQNITVNYNYNNAPLSMPSIIPIEIEV